jgi:hypothetical protein
VASAESPVVASAESPLVASAWSPAGRAPGDSLLDECRLMLEFARELGLALSPELMHDIAGLDRILAAKQLPTVSGLPRELIEDPQPVPVVTVGDPPAPAVVPPAPVPPPLSAAELVLRIHGSLSMAIAPATPLTLQATQPRNGKGGMFARMPRLVKYAAGIAVLSGLGFIVSAGGIAATSPSSKEKGSATVTTGSTETARDASVAGDAKNQ